MAGNILTPTDIWQDFTFDGECKWVEVGKEKRGNVKITRFVVDGNTAEDGQVKIMCVMARKLGDERPKCPAVLVVQDFVDGADTDFICKLAESGFVAFNCDLGGKCFSHTDYTVYPESLSYANFKQESVEKATVEGEIRNSCYYEWTTVLRYVIRFIKSLDFIGRLGAIGIGESATCLWQACLDSQNIAGLVFVSNAGWKAERGKNKFSSENENSEFSDEQFKYSAGIEPQSYASHIHCPTYFIGATNSNKYDIDRSYDTLSRIDESVYTGISYSVGSRDSVAYKEYKSAVVFLDELLNGTAIKHTALPDGVSLNMEVDDSGRVLATVTPMQSKGLTVESVDMYFSEGEIRPQYRCWKRVRNASTNGKKYEFVFSPFTYSGIVVGFAKIVYENGFSICSNIFSTKIEEGKGNIDNKLRILYSSRIEDCESSFAPAVENSHKPFGLETEEDTEVRLIKGPFSIQGLSCPKGINTFKIGAKRFMPSDSATLLLDAFVKDSGKLSVSLITDYFGEKIKYTATKNVAGGEFWQNLMFDRTNFKTAEGMPLKSYGKIEAVEFTCDNEFAVNNALWV